MSFTKMKKSFINIIQKNKSKKIGELHKLVIGLNRMMVKLLWLSSVVILISLIKTEASILEPYWEWLTAIKQSFWGEPVKDIWRFGKVSWYEKTLNGSLSTQKRVFAKYIASGIEPLDAYKKAYPKCNSDIYAKQRTQVLLKSEKVKQLIDKEIELLLNDTGITKSYLLEQTKDIVDKKDGRDSDKLRAIETLMKISGLLNTEKTSESVALIQEFTGFSKEKLNAFKSGVLPSGEES